MSAERGAIDLWSGVGLVVASMVGTGVLVSNGFMLGALSAGQIFAVWIVQAGLAIVGAIAYARISRLIPRSGGEFRYLSELFHPGLGYLAGWTSLLVGFAAPVAGAAATAGSFAEEIGMPLPARATAAIVILAVTGFQMFDMRAAKWSQNLFVTIKVTLFVALVGIGFALGSHELPEQTLGNGAPVEVFVINFFFAAYAFSGWNASIYAAEEFRKPGRDVARSMIIGTLAVTALYLLVTYVFVFNLTPEDTASIQGSMERGAHLIVAKLLGPGAAVVASFGIILVLVSSCNAMTLVGPRVNAAMAGDGYLPKIFRSREGKPPTASVALQGAIAMALMLTHSIKGLIQNVGIMLTLMSALTVLGLVRAKFFARESEHGREKLGWGPVAAALVYAGFAGWMIVKALSMQKDEGLASAGAWITGITVASMVAYVATRHLRRSST
ncbi:MAG: APC family permease [Deltaproteobacteria bacterium]|nr:APC family permease [Deltaproteobacteria bacterium]